MALKILLADDSMTAQNMGKKILVDAGFEVFPVSNGAAAIKKIAEHKPDLVILDIYMPGYSGLEVCERVKNAPDTAGIPVLLTVGKMEPYRSEDGAKVRADAVIVKPFEASDLIAAVHRMAQSVAPSIPADTYGEVVEDSGATAEPWNNGEEQAEESESAVQVPEYMMSSPAMIDELPVEDAAHPRVEFAAAAIPPFEPMSSFEDRLPSWLSAAVDTVVHPEAQVAPAFEISETPNSEPQIEPQNDLAAPSFSAQPPSPADDDFAAPEMLMDTFPTTAPDSEEPVAGAEVPLELETIDAAPDLSPSVEVAPGVEFNSEPKVGAVEVAPIPELEPDLSRDDVQLAAVLPDPALVKDATEYVTEFPTRFGVEDAEETVVGIVQPETPVNLQLATPVPDTDAALEQIAPHQAEISAEVAPDSLPDRYFADPAIFDEEPTSVEPPIPSQASPLAWHAEETLVLPAEAAELLEHEIELSREHVAAEEPASPAEEVAPRLEESAAVSISEIPAETETNQDLVDTSEAVSTAEFDPICSAPEIDAELIAAMHAAFNEVEILPVPASPVEVSGPDAEDVEIAQPMSITEEQPTAALLDAPEPEPELKAMAASATPVDTARIAEVVQRVFEKHRAQMVAEIATELTEGNDS